MVSKKSKKADQNINSRLQLVVKSGKYCLGYQGALKTLRQVEYTCNSVQSLLSSAHRRIRLQYHSLLQGKSKLVIIANNCTPMRKSELEYYAMLSKTSVHHYAGSMLCIPNRKKGFCSWRALQLFAFLNLQTASILVRRAGSSSRPVCLVLLTQVSCLLCDRLPQLFTKSRRCLHVPCEKQS